MEIAETSPTTVYVHVPFCVVKCGYCDFNSYTAEGSEPLDLFLDGLTAELGMVRAPRVVPSLFVGGGTPSYLDEPRFERLLSILRQRFDLDAIPEVTMEANPESVTATKAKLAVDGGVRRISIGAQSFAPRYLKFLDRAHDGDQTKAAFAMFREAGCNNISVDLMFGIPGQTLAEWERDLHEALSLQPDHLSCYNLTFEPGTRLHRDLQQGRVDTNEEDVDRQMFLRTRETLQQNGFDAYEVSNFAGRGGPCRHNDHYWLQGDYVGVGPGAAEHHAGIRGTNLKALTAWSDAIQQGLRPTGSAETLTRRQRAAEALWLGLRREEGVDLLAISRRLDVVMQDLFEGPIANFIEQGLLRETDGQLTLTAEGLLFHNTVAEHFLGIGIDE